MNSATLDVQTTPARSELPGRSVIVPPPSTVMPFDARPGEGPGTWIRYAEHPAYAALVAGAGAGMRIRAMATFTKYFALIVCKRLISYELIPTHLRNLRTPIGVWRFMRVAGINALKTLTRRRAALSRPANPMAEALSVDGICVVQLDAAQMSRLAGAAQPLFEQLLALRARQAVEGGRRFEESRSQAVRTAHGELFAAVESMLSASGILEAISSVIGRRASLVDVNPQINDRTDDFWRRIFPDRAREDRPAAYFHRDASGGDVKAILYMSDVSAANGPFSYAVGSQRVRSGHLTDWIEETNDQSACSGTGLRHRQLFAALPGALQKKCAFGNDILPGTEIAERLLAAEWTITAPRGHVVLFDTKGFHRGGMVEHGERRVLTCVIG